MWETISTLKRKNFNILKSLYFQESDKKSIWIINLKNQEHLKFLIDWLKVLPSNFFIIWETFLEETPTNIVFKTSLDKETLSGVDFILTDNDFEELKEYLSLWIAPILPTNNYLWSLLTEFDPLKSEGNSYLYEEFNVWSMFYSTVRYLENFKFPYDNRNLVKNIVSL